MFTPHPPYPKRSLIRLSLGAGGWLFLLALLASLALGAITVMQMQVNNSLARAGLDASAVITHKSSRLNVAGPSKNRTTTYTVRYSFTTADGTPTQGVQNVSKAFFDSVAVGDQRPARYLPANPKTAEVQLGRGKQASSGFLTIAALLFVVGLGGMFIWLRRAQAKISLRETGDMRRAKVMARDLIERKSAAAKHGRAIWRDGDITGQTGTLPVGSLPDVGQMITIYAAPTGKPAIWEGEVGTR